jgi:hypothetical protein
LGDAAPLRFGATKVERRAQEAWIEQKAGAPITSFPKKLKLLIRERTRESGFPGLLVADGLKVWTAVALGGRRAIGIMLKFVYPAAKINFEIRIHREVIFYVCATITNRKASPPPIRGICR